MSCGNYVKLAVGLLLGFGIGLGCRVIGIPSPAPPTLTGALLVLSMTTGWILTNNWAAHHPRGSEALCRGHIGDPGGTKQ